MLTPEQEAAYSLHYGVSRADLKPEVQSAYDRLRAIRVLKAAFVQGRLAKDEFEARVSQASRSQTCAELAAVTADLPAGPSAAPPRAPGWLTMPLAVTCAACTLVLTAIATVAGALGGFPETLLLFLAIFVAFVAGVTMISMAWDNRRFRKQLPQAPVSDVGRQ